MPSVQFACRIEGPTVKWINPNLARRDKMVAEQIAVRGVHDTRVLDAMRKVAREAFVPEELRAIAYEDNALPIGEGQTISHPTSSPR
jgi:protein-L-isoaspartate O-methyltransferase